MLVALFEAVELPCCTLLCYVNDDLWYAESLNNDVGISKARYAMLRSYTLSAMSNAYRNLYSLAGSVHSIEFFGIISVSSSVLMCTILYHSLP